MVKPSCSPGGSLTAREIEVCTLIAAGKTDLEIAKQLSIATATVNHHISHAREKMGSPSRTQAIALLLIEGQICGNTIKSIIGKG